MDSTYLSIKFKMKKLAIIGASYLQLPLDLKAKEMGLHTICFAWLKDAVCKEVADEFYDISIIEKDRILEKCEQIGIDGICTIASDVAAPTVAYVAERLGLKSNSFSCAVLANNKSLMRSSFLKAGIPCPQFRVVEAASDLKDLTLNYPLIVKPTDRSGSLGVSRVDNIDELKKALNVALDVSFKRQAIIEEYIEGREISVEFISYQGKHYPLTITDKVTTDAPHFVELEHHQPADLSQNLYKTIYDLNTKALSALGITNGASHAEYKLTPSGELFVIEIGGRMGGDFIGSDLVQLSTGYEFLKGVINVALGQFEEPVVKNEHHSGVYFLCKKTERLLPVMEHPEKYPEIVECSIQNMDLKNIQSSKDRSGYVIYQSDKKWII